MTAHQQPFVEQPKRQSIDCHISLYGYGSMTINARLHIHDIEQFRRILPHCSMILRILQNAHDDIGSIEGEFRG